MKQYYHVTSKIKDVLAIEPFVKTITFGSIFDVDLNKQILYPLAHVMVDNAVLTEQTTSFNVSVILMDLINDSKEEQDDDYRLNNNEHDVLNTQLAVGSKLVAQLKRGTLFQEGIEIVGDASCEAFTDRFTNAVGGWTISFNVLVANDMTIC